jgi:transcriptional antiterminator RfaH
MDNSPRWFCARAKPGQDRTAVTNLLNQHFEIYYPRIQVKRVRKRRVCTESLPVFPNYILIKSTLSDSAWRAINSTRGVLKLISFSENGYPSCIPEMEVERLKERERRGELNVYRREMRKGDKVRLRSGYAVDAIGTVVFTNAQRVELLISLLGRSVRVIAPHHAVAPHP